MNVVFLVAGAAATLASERVTPVEKVTELLVKIKERTIEQGKLEKELFGKFNDFCHNQEDDKFWRAAKGAKKVDRLDAEIEELSAQIDKKTRKIEDLDGEVEKNEDTKATETADMEEKSKEDAAALKDFDTVLSQIKRAIKHLTGSDVSGTGLMELTSMLETSLRLKQPPRKLQRLSEELLQSEEPGKPHSYKFHSTVVITLLEELATEFKNQRLQRDNEALAARSQSEHSITQLANLIASLGHQKDEFEEEVAAHKLQKEESSADRALTAKHLFEDTDFAHHLVGCDQFAAYAEKEEKQNLVDYLPRHLKDHGGCPSDIGECGVKRENYAARVKTREEELVALTQAIELMQGEGGTSYKSNKRLTALQMEKPPKEEKKPVQQHVITSLAQDAREQIEEQRDEEMMDEDEDEDEETATSFLQMSRRKTAQAKLLKFLTLEAGRLRSTMLSSVLLRVQMGKDHFKDIRKLITDMIDKLEKQLASEQEQKEWCDKQLTETHKKRQEAQDAIELATSTIDSETAKRDLLVKEINELRAEIAEDMAAKEEAANLRNEEKAENKRTVEDAREGLAAVSEGIKILRTFYEANEGNAFVQQEPETENSVEWRAQGAAADGNTIADIRPESDVFSSKYAGNQAESKGVIGILEVVETDYQRTIDTVTEDEKKAEEEWKTADEALANKIKEAEGTVSTKTDDKEAAEEKITTNEGDLKASKKEYKAREEELEQLKPLCSAPEAGDQLEERRKRREQEVASLREALSILREYS